MVGERTEVRVVQGYLTEVALPAAHDAVGTEASGCTPLLD
jgi:hypothetical protein